MRTFFSWLRVCCICTVLVSTGALTLAHHGGQDYDYSENSEYDANGQCHNHMGGVYTPIPSHFCDGTAGQGYGPYAFATDTAVQDIGSQYSSKPYFNDVQFSHEGCLVRSTAASSMAHINILLDELSIDPQLCAVYPEELASQVHNMTKAQRLSHMTGQQVRFDSRAGGYDVYRTAPIRLKGLTGKMITLSGPEVANVSQTENMLRIHTSEGYLHSQVVDLVHAAIEHSAIISDVGIGVYMHDGVSKAAHVHVRGPDMGIVVDAGAEKSSIRSSYFHDTGHAIVAFGRTNTEANHYDSMRYGAIELDQGVQAQLPAPTLLKALRQSDGDITLEWKKHGVAEHWGIEVYAKYGVRSWQSLKNCARTASECRIAVESIPPSSTSLVAVARYNGESLHSVKLTSMLSNVIAIPPTPMEILVKPIAVPIFVLDDAGESDGSDGSDAGDDDDIVPELPKGPKVLPNPDGPLQPFGEDDLIKPLDEPHFDGGGADAPTPVMPDGLPADATKPETAPAYDAGEVSDGVSGGADSELSSGGETQGVIEQSGSVNPNSSIQETIGSAPQLNTGSLGTLEDPGANPHAQFRGGGGCSLIIR